jgi:hypothetical protein
MAWTSGDFEGPLTAKAAVAFVFGEDFARQDLLDAIRDRDVVYAAVRSEGGEVWGLVLIVKREGKRLHVKRISEDMGPDDDRCPSKILDLLSEPPSNEWACDWRARCRARGRQIERSD